jgi:hypothetical protein
MLREPLLHFLLLGAALFVAYQLLQRSGGSSGPREIVVTLGQIEQLAAGFSKVWQRQPTADELVGLVRDRVREEIYCREALALGLDRDDTVIRRRLRQKMEFVSDDIAALAEPTDADLEEYLRAHPDAFRVEPRCTFQQLYLDPQKHAENLAGDVALLLERLDQAGAEADLTAMGDSLMLEPRFAGLTTQDVAQQFGEPFALALGRLEPGRWQGPVESGYGVHLVFVSERTEGRLPALAEVRDAVRREWDNARRIAANEAFYQELLKRYTVTIESVDPLASGVLAAEKSE